MVVAGAACRWPSTATARCPRNPGASDVLAALGINLDVPLPAAGGAARGRHGLPGRARHHAALRHAGGARVELGTRTIFNLLGPLANPGRVKRQMTGAFSPDWLQPMAEALAVSAPSAPGWCTARAWTSWPSPARPRWWSWPTAAPAASPSRPRRPACRPPDRNHPRRHAGGECRGAAGTAARAHGGYRDMVLLNSAASLRGRARGNRSAGGHYAAAESIDSGRALDVLNRLRRATTPRPDPHEHRRPA
jgi:anthranilate phosphoribosyltransferase